MHSMSWKITTFVGRRPPLWWAKEERRDTKRILGMLSMTLAYVSVRLYLNRAAWCVLDFIFDTLCSLLPVWLFSKDILRHPDKIVCICCICKYYDTDTTMMFSIPRILWVSLFSSFAHYADKRRPTHVVKFQNISPNKRNFFFHRFFMNVQVYVAFSVYLHLQGM